MSAKNQSDDWRCHGWDDHIIGQIEHGRSLTFRQKLEWLEEAHLFVRHFQNASITYGPTAGSSGRVEEPPPPET